MTAISDLLNEINRSADNKKYPLAILCDLSKAFDCVDHDELIDKLHRYGIRGVANDWFQSYLSNRTQTIEITFRHTQRGTHSKNFL